MNFDPLLGKHKFWPADISHNSCPSATKFDSVWGLANGHLFPKFGKLWLTFPGSTNFGAQILKDVFL